MNSTTEQLTRRAVELNMRLASVEAGSPDSIDEPDTHEGETCDVRAAFLARELNQALEQLSLTASSEAVRIFAADLRATRIERVRTLTGVGADLPQLV